MPVMLPSAELLAQWAAEQLWDWRVRLLFTAICVLAIVAVLVTYAIWARNDELAASGRARIYINRIAVTLAVVAAGEQLFFKDMVSTAILLGTAAVLFIAALSLPAKSPADATGANE